MDVPLAGRVEAVGRLVEHQQPRPGRAGRRPARAAAACPSEKPRTRSSATSVEPDLVEQRRRRRRGVRDRTPRRAASAVEVLPGGQRRIEAGAVDEARDAVGRPRATAHRRTEDLQRARRRPSPGRAGGRAAWSCRRRWGRPGRGSAPAATSRSTPSRAMTSPKDLVIPRARAAGVRCMRVPPAGPRRG